MKRKTARVMLLLIIAALAVPASGCAPGPGQAGGQDTTGGAREAGGSIAGGPKVTMCGRSVMYGWMQHWGYQGSGTVNRGGYTFKYRELDGSRMADSFKSATSDLPGGSVVFFKFCFVDFDGTNLSGLESEVNRVVAYAAEKGFTLILGNALPVRRADAPEGITAEYAAFNSFLERTAASSPNVRVFDFYGVLAGPDGYLRAAYDTGDSHPNDEAYGVLDETFFDLLGKVFSG